MPILLMSGCAAVSSACRGGGQACAAARVPEGMREVRRGYRIVNAQWQERINKESGLPDIGIQAEWAPVVERR